MGVVYVSSSIGLLKVIMMLNVAALAFTSFADPGFPQLLAGVIELRLNKAWLLTDSQTVSGELVLKSSRAPNQTEL